MRHWFALMFILLVAIRLAAFAGPATITSGTMPLYSDDYMARLSDRGECYSPYHRVTGSPIWRTINWEIVTLENDYVRVVVSPQMGGRVLKFINKATGSNQFWENPSGGKLSPWGRLGWSLSSGGTEIMVPWDEHAATFYLPWSHHPSPSPGKTYLMEDLDWGVRLVMVYREATAIGRTRWRCTLTVDLPDDVARYDTTLRIENESNQSQFLEAWTNCVISPGPGNMEVGANPRNLNQHIVLPRNVSSVYNHNDNAGQSFFGGPWNRLGWPVHTGLLDGQQRSIDISRIQNFYTYGLQYCGIFVPAGNQATFCGLYNLGANEGFMKVFPAQIVPGVDTGVKFWQWGSYAGTASSLFSDGRSTMTEIMSGPCRVFQEPANCSYPNHPTGEAYGYWQPAGSVIEWTDRHMAPFGIGDMVEANADVVLNFVAPNSATAGSPVALTLGVFTVRAAQDGLVTVTLDGIELYRQANVATSPSTSPGPYYRTVSPTLYSPGAGTRTLTFTYASGTAGTLSTSRTIQVSGSAITPTATVPPTRTPTATPVGPDSDGDGIPDAIEPELPNLWQTSRYLADSDGDGLSDGVEDANRNGFFDSGETSARLRDTDGDTVEDGIERLLSADPLNPSVPAPALRVDVDGDALPDAFDPNTASVDGDGDRYRDGYDAAAMGAIHAAFDAGLRPTLGDIDRDGFVGNLDALIIHSFFLRLIQYGQVPNLSGADITRDAAITNLDALALHSVFLSLIPAIPLP